MQIRSAALTDIGLVRAENEDRFLCDDALGLYGVADGIGGLPGGAEAAEKTVTLLQGAIAAAPKNSLPDLVYTSLRLNEAIHKLATIVSPLVGMGTTLTYGLIRESTLHLAHIGDSRCYLLRKQRLKCLTIDHTVENEIRRRRGAGEYGLYDESQRAALTRCIGQHTPPEVDTVREKLLEGDRIFFCTDGIDKAIEEEELELILFTGKTPQETLQTIVDLANKRGGGDNATGVLIFVDAA